MSNDKTCFFTLVTSQLGEHGVRLMIESLRSFGGNLKDAPVWVFYWQGYRNDPSAATGIYDGLGRVSLHRLELDEDVRNYMFGGKVSVCAQAEKLAALEMRQMIWFAQDCLIINSPRLFELGSEYDAAFRPVHITNVGSPVGQPLDEYWGMIYQTIGIEDTDLLVESYVDSQMIRPYFNSHIFSIDPSLGVMNVWLDYFCSLVSDVRFQDSVCGDQLHKIFLHQAVLSAVLIDQLDWARIRMLPPEYSYPIHFHRRVPGLTRPASLNELICIAYEDVDLHPERLDDIQIHEPLRSWLVERLMRE